MTGPISVWKSLRQKSPLWLLIGGVTAVHLLLAAVSFLKDISYAAAFGTSATADLIHLSFLLPETISYNLFAGVISIAAVPVLSRLWAERSYDSFILHVLRLAAYATLFMTALGIILLILRPFIFTLYGYAPNEAVDSGLDVLYRLLLMSLPLFPLFAIGAAALIATNSFYVAAAGPIVLNILMLAAAAAVVLLPLEKPMSGTVYAGAILIGAALMAAWMWTALRRRLHSEGLSLRLAWASRKSAIPSGAGSRLSLVYRDFMPLLLLTLCVQTVYAAERMMASRLTEGALAALNYAFRVAQFPNWVFVAAVTSVLLPEMSRNSSGARRDTTFRQRKRAVSSLFRTLKVLLLIIVPAAAVLCLSRDFLIQLLFARGAFGSASVMITTDLLMGYSLAMVGQAVSTVCARFFLAEGRLYPSVLIYLISALVTLTFDLLTVQARGAAALGYGAFLGWTVNAVLMVWLAANYSKNGEDEHG